MGEEQGHRALHCLFYLRHHSLLIYTAISRLRNNTVIVYRPREPRALCIVFLHSDEHRGDIETTESTPCSLGLVGHV